MQYPNLILWSTVLYVYLISWSTVLYVLSHTMKYILLPHSMMYCAVFVTNLEILCMKFSKATLVWPFFFSNSFFISFANVNSSKRHWIVSWKQWLDQDWVINVFKLKMPLVEPMRVAVLLDLYGNIYPFNVPYVEDRSCWIAITLT